MSLLARVVYASMLGRDRRRARATARRRKAGETVAPAADAHLETGRRGEALAYWYLRRQGYTVVAQNLRLRPDTGELDLVGWDGPVLAFVEVKTRTSVDAGLPAEAVSRAQRQRIAKAAAVYVGRLKPKEVNYRFDIISVVWDRDEGYQLSLIKDAFRPAGALKH
ncbi:MAG: YraN family protein [Terriglobia bacterium]